MAGFGVGDPGGVAGLTVAYISRGLGGDGVAAFDEAASSGVVHSFSAGDMGRMQSMRTHGSSLSSNAILAGTGRLRAYWHRKLDAIDVTTLGTIQAARVLVSREELSSWWALLLTVDYERSCGIHRRTRPGRDAMQLKLRRTVAVAVGRLWQVWSSLVAIRGLENGSGHGSVQRLRYQNVSDDGELFHEIVQGKRLQFTFESDSPYPGTTVEVCIRPMRKCGSLLLIEQTGLPSSKAVVRMKALWQRFVDRVQARFEPDRV